eukprot:4338684-Amphidinium_carterae.1
MVLASGLGLLGHLESSRATCSQPLGSPLQQQRHCWIDSLLRCAYALPMRLLGSATFGFRKAKAKAETGWLVIIGVVLLGCCCFNPNVCRYPQDFFQHARLLLLYSRRMSMTVIAANLGFQHNSSKVQSTL